MRSQHLEPENSHVTLCHVFQHQSLEVTKGKNYVKLFFHFPFKQETKLSPKNNYLAYNSQQCRCQKEIDRIQIFCSQTWCLAVYDLVYFIQHYFFVIYWSYLFFAYTLAEIEKKEQFQYLKTAKLKPCLGRKKPVHCFMSSPD